MSDNTNCARCKSGPVHRFEDASQCANCGAYTDNHHTYQPVPEKPIKPSMIPHSSGFAGSIGLQMFTVRQIMPDLDLTH